MTPEDGVIIALRNNNELIVNIRGTHCVIMCNVNNCPVCGRKLAALRFCSDKPDNCIGCPVFSPDDVSDCTSNVMNVAANIIDKLEAENDALNTKMNEIQDIINYAQGEIEQSIQYEAQIKFLKKDCYNLKAETAALREKLAAAVRDIKAMAKHYDSCLFCKDYTSGLVAKSTCCRGYEWRGGQEGAE